MLMVDLMVIFILNLMNEYKISPRLTFSNSLLEKKHLSDKKCNEICRKFDAENGNYNPFVSGNWNYKTLKNNLGKKVFVSFNPFLPFIGISFGWS